MKDINELSCVFDDSIRYSQDKNHTDLYYTNGFVHNNELYYVVEKKDSSSALIEKALDHSNAFWHSLCILTKMSFIECTDKKLSLKKIKQICVNAQLVILGAYDGEGYIFWGKDGFDDIASDFQFRIR